MTIFLTEDSNILNIPNAEEFNFWFSGYKVKPIIFRNWKPISGFLNFISTTKDRINWMMNVEFAKWKSGIMSSKANFFYDGWSFPVIFQPKFGLKISNRLGVGHILVDFNIGENISSFYSGEDSSTFLPQFFEFLGAIAGSSTDGGKVRLPPVRMQPIAADDVAAALADVTVGTPVNGIVELAGPESLPLDELVRRFLSATGDSRPVIADAHARYFGAQVNDSSLTPGDNARIGSTRFERWLKQLQ